MVKLFYQAYTKFFNKLFLAHFDYTLASLLDYVSKMASLYYLSFQRCKISSHIGVCSWSQTACSKEFLFLRVCSWFKVSDI